MLGAAVLYTEASLKLEESLKLLELLYYTEASLKLPEPLYYMEESL